MKKCAAIGEALIDFIPFQKGCMLKEVAQFERVCGGAPCNVAAAIAKLGGNARMITQLGEDNFGDYILDVLNGVGVDTGSVLRTDKANTSLAFVSLKADGDREFSFYRKPASDLLLEPDSLKPEWFEDLGILHFCSVDLVESPMRYAHRRAIRLAIENGALISFDPNLRPALWGDMEECRRTVREYMTFADILKISDNELEFITGENEIGAAAEKLFDSLPKLKLLLYTMGKGGAAAYTRNINVSVDGADVKVCDTTGAGDSIIGAFLYRLAADDADGASLSVIGEEKLRGHLVFAYACSGISVTKKGAIASYADLEEAERFIREHDLI